MEIIILIIIIVAIAAMWSFYYFQFHHPKKAASKFSIGFPAKPKTYTATDKAPRSGLLIHTLTNYLETPEAYYFIQQVEFPPQSKFSGKEQELLNRLADDAAKLAHGKVDWKNYTPFRKLPTINYSIEGARSNYQFWRGMNILVGTDAYLIKMAFKNELDEPAFQRFIASFKSNVV